MMPKSADKRGVWLAAAAGAVLISITVGARASLAQSGARVARTLNVTDVARLHLVHSSGELLVEEGPATGALAGTVHVRVQVSESVTGSFTIYARGGGSITGYGSARLHSTGTYASFGGSLSVSHGTGRYAHAHGNGGLYGVVDRRTDAMTVQTTGRLSY
jgi:hypothetical protein